MFVIITVVIFITTVLMSITTLMFILLLMVVCPFHQDVSYNMGVLTNKLFQLEDKIDIITSCNLLPIIDVSPTLTPTASTTFLPGH